MKLFAITTHTAGALAAAALALSGAATAIPAEPAPAAIAVSSLQAGLRVNPYPPAGINSGPQSTATSKVVLSPYHQAIRPRGAQDNRPRGGP